MCIVIDINVLTPVFDQKCTKHSSFVHVKEWIDKGLGFLVFGGSKYKSELEGTIHHLRMIRRMKDAGMAVPINDDIVDRFELQIKKETKGTDCDDQHIVALLAASRCPILCSEDKRSFPYIHDKKFYPKGMPRVKIYTSPKNKNLLKRSKKAALYNIAV